MKELKVAEYAVEVWNWRTNTLVMDITKFITSEIQISWALKDAEQVSFSVDLLRYSEYCTKVGLDATTVLEPYARDIRIKRNNVYLVGANIVDANISIPEDGLQTIQVKAMGFLNCFKDKYMTIPYSNYTYPQMASSLVATCQQTPNLVSNSTIDIDLMGWLASTGSIAKVDTSPASGGGCLAMTMTGRSSQATWASAAYKVHGVSQGEVLRVQASFKSPLANTQWSILQRQIASLDDETQQRIAYGTMSRANIWYSLPSTAASFTAAWDDPVILFCMKLPSDTVKRTYYLDNVSVKQNLLQSLFDLNVSVQNYSVSGITITHEMNFDQQNVKDAIVSLSEHTNEKYDFYFDEERNYYNVASLAYSTVNHPYILSYPGNVTSLTVDRTASEVANEVLFIGSGMGEERVQTSTYDVVSMEKYGHHQTIISQSNDDLQESIDTKASTELSKNADPKNTVKIVCASGETTLSDVRIGEIVRLVSDTSRLPYEISGDYKIINLDVSIGLEAQESINLTLQEA